MINGIHALIYSKDATRVRSFLKDVLGLPSVDAGDGWSIFASPPAELAVNPTDGNGHHELYFMCDDIQATVKKLRTKKVKVLHPIADRGWRLATRIRPSSGDEFGLYEPKHPTPIKLKA